MSPNDVKSVEVLDPTPNEEQNAANYYLAQISNYTDRPDLLIAEIEKHDPGFVKRMNEASERDAAEFRKSRFRFGRAQAYAGLAVAVLAAISILGILSVAVWKNQGFWTILALGVVYAITQGGSQGFRSLIEGVQQMLPGKAKNDSSGPEGNG